MKLSIIIVSWNVRELLEKCLESLFLYAPNVSFEVCVVDNASHDESVAMIQRKFPQVNVLVNKKNEGFAKACNQGVQATSGEYILFLNPDTVVTPTSFKPLIATLDEHRDVALAAPQLLHKDGSIQPSVRRFPTPLKAVLEFFRLTKPREVSFFETTDVEQPMGAAMMIRRSVFDKLRCFDEKFFIWYEEVDLCKRIRDAGHKILYVSQAQIMHVGGESFSQHPTFRKQRFYYKSYATYLWKHWKWRALLPVTLMKMYTGILIKPFFWLPLLLIGFAEILSLVGYFSDLVRIGGFVFVTALVFFLSLRNLSYGIMALAAELVIGSKGHLFSIELGEFSLSIRMALFLTIFLAWAYHLFQNNQRFLFLRSMHIRWYALLMAFFGWGVVNGILNNNGLGAMFKDANAWLFFLLAFPLYDAIRSYAAVQRLVIVILAALIAQFAKTSLALYIMSHKSFGVEVLYPFYRWIRDTGIGEITQFEWGVTRVFFQSGIYPMIALFILLPTLLFFRKASARDYFFTQWKNIALFSSCVAILLIGFSRSFWIAALCTIVIIFIWLVAAKKWMALVRMIGIGGVSFIAAFAWIAAITFLPIPSQKGGIGLDAFAKRFEDIDSEAAAASRWSLLPALQSVIQEHPFTGHGFGKKVTYVSYDPRVREQNKSGTFTTHSFEWGWLDFIVKMGVGGLLAYLSLLVILIKNGMVVHRKNGDHFITGLILGLIAITVVHVFTPYLNHPLGIAYILFIGLAIDVFTKSAVQSDTV